MNNRFYFFLFFAPLLLTGCLSKSPKTNEVVTPSSNQTALNIDSFDDIDPAQVTERFTVNGETYALVQQPSDTIPLSVSDDFKLQFLGLLKESGDDAWIKVAQIEDIVETGEDLPKNNPIAVWEEKGTIRMGVVDQLGDKNGEGIFKVFVYKNDRIWVQESCGYYSPEQGNFLNFDDRVKFEYFQFNSIDKQYQSGPIFVKEAGEERMVNEPACDNVFVSTIID